MSFPQPRFGRFRCALVLALFAGCGYSQRQTPVLVQADQLFHEGSDAFAAGNLVAAEAAFSRLVRLAPRVGAAHSGLGAVLLAEGKAALAAPELRTALTLTPMDSRAAINLGLAYRALHEDGKSAEAFGRAAALPGVSFSPEESAAFAGALAGEGHLADARSVLETALSTSTDPMLLDTLGAVLAQMGDLQDARSRFEQALAARPEMASAHAHLGSLELLSQNSQAAAVQLETAVRLGDSSAVTAAQWTRALLATAHNAEALSVAQRAVAASPNSADVKYALALSLQANDKPAEALPYFKAVATQRPNSAEVLVNYGLALVQTGDAKSAIATYAQALAMQGSTPTLRENLGAAYLQQNDPDHAIEQFRAGLKTDPDNVQLHYDLGLAYKLKDNTEAATEELRRAEQLDPNLPDPPYTLGVLDMQQGQFKTASEDLEKALALQPQNPDGWALLGSVYQQAHEPAKAATALRHAIVLSPNQPSPHVTLAAVLSEQGNRQSAAAERKIAADLSRAAVAHQRAQFALKSGLTLLQQGKLQEALQQLHTAVDAEPDEPDAHLALAAALQRSGQTGAAALERDKAAALKASPGDPAASAASTGAIRHPPVR